MSKSPRRFITAIILTTLLSLQSTWCEERPALKNQCDFDAVNDDPNAEVNEYGQTTNMRSQQNLERCGWIKISDWEDDATSEDSGLDIMMKRKNESTQLFVSWIGIFLSANFAISVLPYCHGSVVSAILFLMSSLLWLGAEVAFLILYKDTVRKAVYIKPAQSTEELDTQIEVFKKLVEVADASVKLADQKVNVMAGLVAGMGAAFLMAILEATMGDTWASLSNVLTCPRLTKNTRPTPTLLSFIFQVAMAQTPEIPDSPEAAAGEEGEEEEKPVKALEQSTVFTDDGRRLNKETGEDDHTENWIKENDGNPILKDLESSLLFFLGGFGGGTAAIVTFTKVLASQKKALFNKYLLMMSQPLPRAIFLAGINSLSATTLALSVRQREMLKKRKNVIEGTLKNLEYAKKNKQEVTKDEVEDYVNNVISHTLPTETEVQQSTDTGTCFVSGKLSNIQLDRKCECKKTNTCEKDIKNKLAHRGFLKNSPITPISASINKATKSVFNNDLQSASAELGTLGRFAGPLKKLQRKYTEKLNKDREKKKLPPVDFEKVGEKVSDELKSKVASVMKNNPLPASAVSDFESGHLPGSDQDLGGKSIKDKINSAGKDSFAGGGGGGAPTGSSSAKKEEEEESDFDLDLDFDDDEEESVASSGPSTMQEALQDHQTDMGDIVRKKGTSIFKLLSKRYLISGYPALLEE